MKRYTATEMRKFAGDFRQDVKAGEVEVTYMNNSRRYDFAMVAINKDRYDGMVKELEGYRKDRDTPKPHPARGNY